MSRLSDVTNAAIRSMLAFKCLTSAGLAITSGGTAATFLTGGTVTFINKGQLITKTAISAGAMTITSGLKYVQPASATVYYTIGLDNGGNIKVTQGSYAGQKIGFDPTVGIGGSAQAGATWVGDGSIPDVADGVTAIGVIKIVTDSTHTFTPATTNLDASGVTASYYNVAVLPASAADLV